MAGAQHARHVAVDAASSLSSAPLPVPHATAPPPAIPLAFLGAAGVGLVGFGFALWFAADRVVSSPTHLGAVSAVHVCMLAFLTTAVLGALHQFVPVVGDRSLRSSRAAWATLVGIVATAWLLPTGFVHGPEWLVAGGGTIGAVAVLLAAWNLSRPLGARGGGVPIMGLRLSVAYLVATVAFGAVCAFDRRYGWFPLYSHRVLAHAHLGLLGWLGLTYVSVVEKLGPMFLLALRPRARAGSWAVGALAAGVPLLAVGLLLAEPSVAWPGGVLAAVGVVCHASSLMGAARHRQAPLVLLHAFVFASAVFVLAAVVFAAAAALADVSPDHRAQLVTAEVASLTAWLGLAVLGHAHKIVPGIVSEARRTRDITAAGCEDPQPTVPFRSGIARLTFVTAAGGFAAAVVGVATESASTVAIGGAGLALTGLLVSANLSIGRRP